MVTFAKILLFGACVVAPLRAQERFAEIRTEDGRQLAGRVVAMSLDTVELDVGGRTERLPANQIRSCRFTSADVEDPAAEPSPAAGGESAGGRLAANGGGVPGAALVGDDGVVPAAAGGTAGEGAAAGARPRRTLPAPPDTTAGDHLPVDRRVPLWRQRLAALDEAYPWLAPTEPAQWISLGLLLLISTGLAVHLSVHVAGADGPRLGRSVGLGVWYLVTGLAQAGAAPATDLSLTVMLLANTTFALLWLRLLFGVGRGAALVALLVQLGFGVLVFGVLELVTSLLGSVGVTP